MAEMIVVDTTILVDVLRGHDAADEAILNLRWQGRLLVHAVGVAELLAGAKERGERRTMEKLLARFDTLIPIGSDFEVCLRLFRRVGASDGAGWPDCLIAATCLRLRAVIVTTNDKHFRGFNSLKVKRPY